MWDAGTKQADIARALNVSQSGASRPLKKHRETSNFKDRKRSGRPRVDRLLLRFASCETLWNQQRNTRCIRVSRRLVNSAYLRPDYELDAQ